jgi:hypothetical protein
VVLAAAALIALFQAAPSMGEDRLVLRESTYSTRFRVDPSLVSPALADELSGGGDNGDSTSATPPPCAADVCQPRVAVPGFDRKLQFRRTELFLSLLDRVHFEPIASLAWAIAASGVRLDYTPSAMNGPDTVARGGWGRFQVWLTFRLDAANAPVIMERPGRPVTPSP